MKTIARFFAAAIFCAGGVANAQDYPAKPIRFIVPLTPGSGADILGMTPYVMITAKGGAYPNLKSLIDAAKANPGQVPFASAGVGSSTHMAAEYLAQVAGIKMLHIPYKGSPEAIQDTIAGRTSFYMAPLDVAIGPLKDGKITPFGVSTAERSAIVPEIPTLAEQGLANYSLALWFGMWARAGTPRAVVQKLNAQVNAIVQGKEVHEQFGRIGIAPAPMKPEEFAKFVREQMGTFRKIAREANIQPQ